MVKIASCCFLGVCSLSTISQTSTKFNQIDFNQDSYLFCTIRFRNRATPSSCFFNLPQKTGLLHPGLLLLGKAWLLSHLRRWTIWQDLRVAGLNVGSSSWISSQKVRIFHKIPSMKRMTCRNVGFDMSQASDFSGHIWVYDYYGIIVSLEAFVKDTISL